MTDAELCHLLNLKEVHIIGATRNVQPRPPCDHQILETGERYACKHCGQIFGWVSSFDAADVGDPYYKHHVWKKPKPPKSRKTLQKYNICFQNGEAGEIEYKLNQVLNGRSLEVNR